MLGQFRLCRDRVRCGEGEFSLQPEQLHHIAFSRQSQLCRATTMPGQVSDDNSTAHFFHTINLHEEQVTPPVHFKINITQYPSMNKSSHSKMPLENGHP